MSESSMDRPSAGSRLAPLLKRLGRPVGKKKRPTRLLWQREFDIVDKGLDEEQVVAFVNGLVAEYESSSGSSAEEAKSLPRGTGEKALRGLLEERENIEGEVREEYSRAYSRLLASLQELIGEGAHIEGRLKEKTAKLVEVLSQEAQEFERIFSQSGEMPDEALARSEAMARKITEGQLKREGHPEEEPASGPAKTEKSGQKSEEVAGLEGNFIPLQPGDQTLISGEVELDIATPVDAKVVSRLFNYLQTVPEVKVLHTRGSWDHGPTITIVLEKPVPFISLISKVEGIKGKLSIEQGDGEEEKKDRLLLRRKKGTAKRIRLVLAKE